jgi:hypothetical protein
MLRQANALTLGLWTLHAPAWAANPARLPDDNAMAQVAISMHTSPLPQTQAIQETTPAITASLQLLVPADNALSHPQKEDWLESDGHWQANWLLPNSQVDSGVPQSAYHPSR